MFQGSVVADGVGAVDVKCCARLDIDGTGIFRLVVVDGHVGERGRAAINMYGPAIAFVLIVAALGKGFVTCDGASIDGKGTVAPDGTAACSSGVEAHVAAADISCAVVYHTAAAGSTPAIGNGAARNGQ